MELVIFNSLLYNSTFLIYWLKRRKIDAGFVLLGIYAAISIASVFLYAEDPEKWRLQLWPFLYLYFVCMLFFTPFFFNSDLLYHKLVYKKLWFLKSFTIFYIACGLVSIYYSANEAMINITSGEWSSLRNELYKGEVRNYNNQLERFAEIVIIYFKPLAIIAFFYYLSSRKIKLYNVYLLGLAIIVPTFLLAINTASRGLIVSLSFALLIGFILFKEGLSHKIKKVLIIFSFIFIALFLIYSIAVTISRFGENSQASSLLEYFGISMLAFNYGMVDSIHTFGNGSYFFDWFLPFFGQNSFDTSTIGTHFGTSFFTFVGAWYLDFGPIGTVLIAIFLPLFIGSRFRYTQRIDFADLFLFLFYLNYLIMGVFVIGRGNSLAWIITFTIYGILKLIR